MTERETRELLPLVRRTAANLRYFFDRLEDPAWIPLLEEEGFFSKPPDPERTQDDEGSWVRFPDWPASRFLTRVAFAAPERVAHVLLGLPETDNVRVHTDIVEAACQLPPEWAARLAESELKWFSAAIGPLLNYGHSFVGLALYLLHAGERDIAVRMLDAVLELSPAQTKSARPRVGARLSEWQYAKTLEEIWPALLGTDGVEALRFIGSKLLCVIALSMREGDYDATSVWRPAIEVHSQNLGNSIFDALVDATRDLALAAAADAPADVLDVLADFEAQIFDRLRLHILRVVGDRLPEKVAEALLDNDIFKDPGLWHEYAELLRARFGELIPAEQTTLLGMIDQGAEEDGDGNGERAAVRRAYHRYKLLALIADHLEGRFLDDYEALATRFGPPDHPEFLSYSESWTGPTSPLSADEIAARSPAELVAYLSAWEPEDTPGPHSSPEGLGRVLAQVIGRTPDPYAAEAPLFAGTDPTYIRALFSGLEEALKHGRCFDWGPPLALADWVLRQPEIEHPDMLHAERDPGFRWTRRQIASLIGRGLEDGAAACPGGMRGAVWAVLSALIEDADPAPREERSDGGMDPATLSLNVTRGAAMHAVVRFVLWIERLEGEQFQGLASVPEAQTALERHLDLDIEPSLAVRAVYGMWLAQLARIDEAWVVENADAIFPTEADAGQQFGAAWSAYVVFTRPWLGVLGAAERAYHTAVERLGEDAPHVGISERPDEALAEHLVWFAVMSAIPTEAPGLWARFWERAPEHLRAHAVQHLGQMLERSTDAPEVRQTVKRLWGWIRKHVAPDTRSATLAPFGWMLGAKELDDEWLLAEAVRLLEEGIHLEPDFVVWDALNRTVRQHPAASASVLHLMVRTDPHGWAARGAESDVRGIVEQVIASGDEEARRRARDAVNLLVS